MSRPEPHQIRDHFDTIRKRTTGTVRVGGKNVQVLDDLERRLLAALDRDRRGGSVVADGFPAATMGGGGGGGTKPGEVKLTSTEAAAHARAGSVSGGNWSATRGRDQLRENVEQAVAYLAQAAASLGAVAARLDNIDGLLEEAPVVPRCCEFCAGAGLEVGPDGSHAPAHFGTVGGRLEVDTHTCDACYQFVFRNGVAPTPEQVAHHDATGSWRVKV